VKYRYYSCDVFTETRFGGNPLAVLPSASRGRQMEVRSWLPRVAFPSAGRQAYERRSSPAEMSVDVEALLVAGVASPKMLSVTIPVTIREVQGRIAASWRRPSLLVQRASC
jgi:hypothetical protein